MNVHAGQPLSCPSISGTSNAISPAVSSTSPTKSYPSFAFPSAPAGRIFAAAISAMTPIGRLTQNTSRHPFSSPNASMISPPRIGPSAVETPITDPMIANALPAHRPREQQLDHRRHRRHEDAAGEPLDHPRDDQLQAVLRQPAEQARHREQQQAGEEHPLVPDAVTDPARRDQRDAERQRVAR